MGQIPFQLLLSGIHLLIPIMPFKPLVITVENTQVNQVLHCPTDYKEDLQNALHDWQLQTITITHI